MILTYELCDDVGNEREEEMATQFDACVRLAQIERFCLWWELTDENGQLLMGPSIYN